MDSQIKLISWNVNGLRAIEKKGFLEWLQGCSADIVAIQETKAQPDQLSETLLRPPGFVSYWHSAEKKGYSGVGTYVRMPPVGIITGLGEERFDINGRLLISDHGKFLLFNTYFPNGGRGPEWVEHKLEFYQMLLENAVGWVNRSRSVVITGDFNTAYAEIDLARPKENLRTSGFLSEEREALGKYYQAGFIDSFRLLHPDLVKYSWWDMRTRARERNLGWRLDGFLVSADLREHVVEADILEDVYGSDHCPVTLTLAW